jgi:RNA polymerase sigma-70 factor (ECF subfamily)
MGMAKSMDQAEFASSSDALAVERTLAGDRDAYRVLVERHSRNIYQLAYRMMGNRQDAEEVVQEAFLRGYQKLKQFAGNANFGTWIYRIAANHAIDLLRQRKTEDSRREASRTQSKDGLEVDNLTRVSDSGPSPERLAGSAELAGKMSHALNTLTPAERTAIVMRHWDGCSIEEIATALKSNANASKNTVFRAVAKLRKALEPFAEARGAVRARGME